MRLRNGNGPDMKCNLSRELNWSIATCRSGLFVPTIVSSHAVVVHCQQQCPLSSSVPTKVRGEFLQ